jgi:D-sedoheptulose 7-phosphate isomerase
VIASTLLADNIAAHRATIEALVGLAAPLEQAARRAADCLRAGGKLLICGNGGSACDAQHFAAEMMGRFLRHREPYAAIALAADGALLTCVGNDYAFDEVFSRQVRGLGRAGDVLFAISTSGQSPNVLAAAVQARQQGLGVIGLLGRDGGRLQAECDTAIVVPSQSTARIQEAHILLIHTLCELIERLLDGEASGA